MQIWCSRVDRVSPRRKSLDSDVETAPGENGNLATTIAHVKQRDKNVGRGCSYRVAVSVRARQVCFLHIQKHLLQEEGQVDASLGAKHRLGLICLHVYYLARQVFV